jgi:uncharacterized protein involved in exopolysaccharide biosynthesis
VTDTPLTGEGEAAPSPLRLLTFVLRHRLAVLYLPLGVAAAVVGWGAFQKRSFTSDAAFMPMASATNRQALAGLAAQFGVALPTQEAGQSPQFYIDLLRSRPILESVATARYTVTTDSGTVATDLVTLLRTRGDTPARRLAETCKRLNTMLGAVAGLRTGVVSLTVRSPYPELSQAIAQRFLDQVDAFNQRGRGSRAAAERRFVKGRLQEAREELATAEDRLLLFTRQNRTFVAASELTVRQDRLQREVSMRQQVYTSLAQAYEQAKIEEVRDTPVLSIVVPPSLPAQGDSRDLAKRGIVLTVFFAVLGGLVSLVRDYTQEHGTDPAMLELRSAWQALRRPRTRPGHAG